MQSDRDIRQPTNRFRLNGWAYVAFAILLVAAMVINLTLVGGLFLALRHHGRDRVQASTSIVVRPPILISGPAIDMSLPAGSNLTSSTVDENGGNWWYEDPGIANLQLLIAASKFGSAQPALNDAYFERVIRIVEHSNQDLVTSFSMVRTEKFGSYDGYQAQYDVAQVDGTHEHAAALLVRRERDDLLIILYGDQTATQTVDQTARKIFESLRPRPTPQQYDVHSVQAVPSRPVTIC